VSGTVEYVVTDRSTGVVESRGTLPTGTACEITERPGIESSTLAFSGGANGTTGRCGFGEFTVPANDYLVLVAQFTGAAGYLASSSSGVQI